MRDFLRTFLASIGEDPDRTGLRETPRLHGEALAEMTAGYKQDPDRMLIVGLLPAATSGMVIIRTIEFTSLCEHHLLPFLGTVSIGYLPGDHMAGLGTIARAVDALARRLQTQERLTEEIAAAMEKALAPRGVGVMIEALHCCMAARGALQRRSTVVTHILRGALRSDAALRGEFLALLGHKNEK